MSVEVFIIYLKQLHPLAVGIRLHLPLAARDTGMSHSWKKWKTYEPGRVILHNLSV